MANSITFAQLSGLTSFGQDNVAVKLSDDRSNYTVVFNPNKNSTTRDENLAIRMAVLNSFFADPPDKKDEARVATAFKHQDVFVEKLMSKDNQEKQLTIGDVRSLLRSLKAFQREDEAAAKTKRSNKKAGGQPVKGNAKGVKKNGIQNPKMPVGKGKAGVNKGPAPKQQVAAMNKSTGVKTGGIIENGKAGNVKKSSNVAQPAAKLKSDGNSNKPISKRKISNANANRNAVGQKVLKSPNKISQPKVEDKKVAQPKKAEVKQQPKIVQQQPKKVDNKVQPKKVEVKTEDKKVELPKAKKSLNHRKIQQANSQGVRKTKVGSNIAALQNMLQVNMEKRGAGLHEVKEESTVTQERRINISASKDSDDNADGIVPVVEDKKIADAKAKREEEHWKNNVENQKVVVEGKKKPKRKAFTADDLNGNT